MVVTHDVRVGYAGERENGVKKYSGEDRPRTVGEIIAATRSDTDSGVVVPPPPPLRSYIEGNFGCVRVPV